MATQREVKIPHVGDMIEITYPGPDGSPGLVELRWKGPGAPRHGGSRRAAAWRLLGPMVALTASALGLFMLVA